MTGSPTGDGTVVSYAVAYRRTANDGIDRIVLSATPADGPAEPGDAEVAGHSATRSSTVATADQPATRTGTWTAGTTRCRIDFIGNGFTDAEVSAVLDGLAESSVAAVTPATPGTSSRTGTPMMSRAA